MPKTTTKSLVYHWHCSYKTTDNCSHYKQLNATTKEQAIIEANQIPNLKKIYEIFRRSE